MANIADLQVSLNLDNTNFYKDIASIGSVIDSLQKSLYELGNSEMNLDLSSVSRELSTLGTSITNQIEKFDDLMLDLDLLSRYDDIKLNVTSNISDVSEDITSVNKKTSNLATKIESLLPGLNSYGESLRSMLGSIDSVSNSIKDLTSDVKELNSEFKSANLQIKQLSGKTITIKADNNVTKVAKDLSGEVYKMTGTFSNLEGTVKRTFTGVGSTMEEAQTNMKSLASSAGDLQQVGSKIQKSFKDASGKIVKTMTEADKAIQKTAKSSKLLENALANVKSVAQGIIIAQTFYNAVNAVQGVANSMWEMHKSVETNTMAFEQLAGSIEMSNEMIEYLQQYAAKSTFTFEQVSQSAKTLLGYGFDLKNLSYVMQTIGDATSAMGKPENFDRIALALGQMLTKGTAKSEEMLQLMEANIPVVEILSEKLGMTAQEVANIGDHSVSSVKVVNALLEGLNERYGGMSENMATTTTGLINNIKESIAYVGSQLFKPL